MPGRGAPPRSRRVAVVAGLLAAVLWGLANVLTKATLGHFAPLPLLLLQLVGSNLLLWALLPLVRVAPIRRTEFAALGWPGLIQPGLAFVLGTVGLAMTTASNDALLWASESVIVLLLAWLVLGRRPGRALMLLGSIALGGVVLATSNPTGEGTPVSLGGNGLILAAVVCGAGYTLVTESQLHSRHPLALLALHQLWGLGFALLAFTVLLPWLGDSVVPAESSVLWLVALGSGVLQFAVPFLLFLVAIEGLGAARASSFLTIPPVVTIIGARFFLGEHLATVQLLGGAVVLGSVLAIQRLAPEGEGEGGRRG